MRKFDLTSAAQDVVAELRELASLTSNENGAQRIAWTPIWDRSIEWFKGKMQAEGAEIHIDAAHNIWAKIEGEMEDAVVIGSHLDCVPDGGWLDGALGIVSGMGILKQFGKNGKKPKHTIYIVCWADEEGARFGSSCVGSAAVSGSLHIEEIKKLKDNDGICFSDALKPYHMKLEDFPKARKEFLKKHIKAYLELHIEQAPLLESQGKSVASVYGITGCERQYIIFTGQSAHSGAPLSMRRDAFLAAAQAVLEFRKIGLQYDAYCTVGKIIVEPNVVTIFPGKCKISLDQRSIQPDMLKIIYEEARKACEKAAKANNVSVSFEHVWSNPPTAFDENLIAACEASVWEETGENTSMFSGSLHDAAEIAKIVPSVMMFAMSSAGLSHCKEENTPDGDLETAIRAFFRLAEKVIQG
ncbi:N-carbamoyl-L-amino-acid hydrolase [Propionispira arboris]|uniref:N-carbamoyl-L-amino-acid hydrolase n=1 Tax=Propionispira arboris TaxID=84035 RepID=A0A1H6V8P1_9FIRM|nr:hydantoinase/carbamoylase family amidase [Propionispira arboris]SEI99274.1 N-carbamoyl-L-amino-acid hydrolase [Propionispira arboris]